MARHNYSDIIYGFDIETTTDSDITAHYLSNFQSVDFKLRGLDREDIISSISNPIFCRSSSDVNDVLIDINNEGIDNDCIYIIFIHNFAYEFDYMIKNVAFIRDNYSKSETLFLKSRIPVIMRLDHIEIRCSYKLLNKSLKALGDDLGYPKLEIDYNTRYYEFSQLPAIEYEYNERDVKLMLLAVLKECNNWSYIKSVKDIPITSTGLTRKNNIEINSKRDRDLWAGMCNYQRKYTADHIAFLESVYSGGYTHANAFYTGQPVYDVLSIDIVSSYIDTILHRDYPHYFRVYKGCHKINYLRSCIRANNGSYLDKINGYKQPFERSFMATIKLKNVRAKILRNDNLILPISYSKCIDIIGCKLDNGRVFKARELTINVNEVDYYIFTQFYDFELVECFELYYTNYHRELPPFVTNSTRSYLNEKSTLKKIIKLYDRGVDIKPEHFYNEKAGDFIYNDDQISALCSMDREQQEQRLNDCYRASKNKLNAQYGINVQKLLQANITYDPELDECLTSFDDHITAKRLYRDFTKGLYITAYSRLNLFMFALYLINNTDTSLIYSDTDSWKCYGDLDNVRAVTEQYNKLIESVVHNSDDYDVGYFDVECQYDAFCTLGCKKYIIADGDRIISTIAGINKWATSKPLTELYQSFGYDFDTLCNVAFSPCTILSSSVTGKLITKYNNDEYVRTVTDVNGDTGVIRGRNMVELVSSDYVLMDVDKHSTNEYIQYCQELQGSEIELIPSLIYRDSAGKITYKYVDDWSNEVKIIRAHNPEFDNIVEV